MVILENKLRTPKESDSSQRNISAPGKFCRNLPKYSASPKMRTCRGSIFKNDDKRNVTTNSFILKNQTNSKFHTYSSTPKTGTLASDIARALEKKQTDKSHDENIDQISQSLPPQIESLPQKDQAGYFMPNTPSKNRPTPKNQAPLDAQKFITRKSILVESPKSKLKLKSSLQDFQMKSNFKSTEKGLKDIMKFDDSENGVESETQKSNMDRSSKPNSRTKRKKKTAPMSTSLSEIEEDVAPKELAKQDVFNSILKINQLWESDKKDPVIKSLTSRTNPRTRFG